MPATDDAKATWLTQDAHDRLSNELNELIANRPVIAAEINARREEGDLKENGGYHAARDNQGQQEGRIRLLQSMLRDAIVATPVDDGVAGPLKVVEVRYEGDDEVETYLIGSREERPAAGLDVFSPVSPVGKALTGKRPGEVAEYATPAGKTMRVTLVSATPFAG